ncbi:selenide, water dikinase SelD [Loktanella sp. IMCC34160]|uniref:selenide, water dikinase SelD n=1 Tax=Loktanella sp. IMCC34160 TaxID=2510646 RepID=UPI00101CF345|nr:selenide, water dikinase SelD [Loktanella sp. IMCC34160]RYG91630.1 selenide, water dikinase SelD [Loktanella sp. IMCC34160]
MMQLPLTRDLVLVGGGHTHALVLRMWGMKPLAGVRLTVINPAPTAPYSGMLPGFVAGHYGKDDLDIDLVQLARFAGARVILGEVTGIDPDKKTITVPGRPPIAYDVASVDVGINTRMPDLPGFADNGIPAKPLDSFARRWATFRDAPDAGDVAVIGGGVAGAELSMAMAFALTERGKSAKVTLIDSGAVLKGFNKTARSHLLRALADNGVAVIENAHVARVTEAEVILADGQRIPSAFTTGAAGARPHDWVAEIGLAHEDGYLTIDDTLRTSDPAIFAAGDCAHMGFAPRPKAGVFAVRQAPVLFDNLRAALSGGEMDHYAPQKDYLKLISLGGKKALAEKLGTAAKGGLLWRWKDRIDRTFMAQFKDLPDMPGPDLPLTMAEGVREALGDKPMCGGCGAKVGRGALRDVLAELPTTPRDDVESLPGDDAAVLITGGLRQIMTTDHLRAFTNDPVLMARIAAIHALGDCWAMGADPQAVTASIILPRMSADLQRRTMSEIMAAAQEVVEAAGAVIVGGHSSLGDELTIGFTVTGLCPGSPITLAGAKPGDALILTKPIGSGTIMAAEMQRKARGQDVAAAFALMERPQAVASRVLRDVAHAMTDVTGFGLAGHLAGICDASGTGAEIDLGEVPAMEGAEALAEAGVRSTLFADNRDGAGPVFGAKGPRGDLLFDPQTAGGLLAAVDPSRVDETLGKLWLAGYPAARIGRITDQPGQITVI